MKIITPANLLLLLKDILNPNPIIIEAGSFIGTDTKRLAYFWPDGIIHAFEPVPEIFAQLEKNTMGISNVHRYPIALSDQNGETTFFCGFNPKKPQKLCQAGTLLQPQERLNWSPIVYDRLIEVQTITLDAWAQENNIKQVDFIWLDIQGHELEVLKKGISLLRQVKALYLEVHFIQAYKNQAHFDEITDWLELQGFTLYATDFGDQKRWFFGNALYLKTGEN